MYRYDETETMVMNYESIHEATFSMLCYISERLFGR